MAFKIYLFLHVWHTKRRKKNQPSTAYASNIFFASISPMSHSDLPIKTTSQQACKVIKLIFFICCGASLLRFFIKTSSVMRQVELEIPDADHYSPINYLSLTLVRVWTRRWQKRFLSFIFPLAVFSITPACRMENNAFDFINIRVQYNHSFKKFSPLLRQTYPHKGSLCPWISQVEKGPKHWKRGSGGGHHVAEQLFPSLRLAHVLKCFAG